MGNWANGGAVYRHRVWLSTSECWADVDIAEADMLVPGAQPHMTYALHGVRVIPRVLWLCTRLAKANDKIALVKVDPASYKVIPRNAGWDDHLHMNTKSRIS